VSKEATIEGATAVCSKVMVFSDGSGKDSQIGATTVLFRDRVEHSSLRKHLGSQEHHTVFETELRGLSLAAELIKAEGHIHMAMIGVDSQAVVLATTHGRGAPGQYLAVGLHQQIAGAWCKHPVIEIEVRWMPGHEGIPGNERADLEAKRAAEGSSSEERLLPRLCRQKLLVSQSTAHQHHRKLVHTKAKEWFKISLRCQRLCQINPTMPSLNFRNDTEDLP